MNCSLDTFIIFSVNSGTRAIKAFLRILSSLLQPTDIMHSLRLKLLFNSLDNSLKNSPEIYSKYLSGHTPI